MKKKHRDITVDGVVYGWIIGTDWVKIYLNKKVLFQSDIDEFDIITPANIAKLIKDHYAHADN
jgi:hypothetical protein